MEPKFIISEVFSTAWKGTKSQLWILAGLLIGYCILSFTLTAFAMPMQSSIIGKIIVNVISALFSIIFSLGYMKNIFQALDGEEPQFSAYGQQTKNIITYFLASLITGFVVLAGFLFFIIPGIYLALRLQFFQAFIIEENAGIIESLHKSWEITKGQVLPLFILALVMIGILILGCILFGIGIFVAVPLIYMMYGYVFRKLNTPLQILDKQRGRIHTTIYTMNKNYRIKDIAELSGVSTGTVDRILHERGKVSEDARKKVEKVLKEIDYQPNLIARSLALKKKYHFIALIPSFHEGEYWAKLSQGIEKAERELFSYNIDVEQIYFDQYDSNSFDELIPKIETADCQGVIIATLFKQSVLTLTQRLDLKGIPYILIDSFIDHTNCISYYGTHSYDSGYIAGRLLFEQVREEDDLVIFRFTRKGDSCSTQVQKREEGFLANTSFKGKIHLLHVHADDREENTRLLNTFFDKYPQVRIGIIFNSRAHFLGDYLSSERPDYPFKLLGYDVIEPNVRYLENGLITHLIAQRPEVQGYHCIKALFRHLILKEKIEPVNYMPIDILVKENIQYYNNYI